ncbi:MAG: hypothetical protein AB8F78_17670 [Saprospiraceae bacterium]
MSNLRLNGKATIGASGPYPMAILVVNRERLEVNIPAHDNLVFQPSDILSIYPIEALSSSVTALKIEHTVASYEEELLFWTTEDARIASIQIQAIGFLDKDNIAGKKINKEILKKQAGNGNPVKKWFEHAVTVVLLVHLALILLFSIFGQTYPRLFGKPILSMYFCILLTAVVSLLSPAFRRHILKKGRDLDDIKNFCIFTILVSGITTLFLTLVLGLHTWP